MRCEFLSTFALGLGITGWSGCQQPSNSPPLPPVLHPVSGKVTVDGKPLAHAVVTFLQVDEKGTLSVGETDDEGAFKLSHGFDPGTAAATYKVAISYLVGTDGTVYGLAPRSGLAKPYGMVTAKELVPREWSDLGRTTQRVTVPEKGGTFNIEIPGPLLPPPTPETPAKAGGSLPPSEPGGAKTDPSPQKAATASKTLPTEPTSKSKSKSTVAQPAGPKTP
jgi:hypothetical protein